LDHDRIKHTQEQFVRMTQSSRTFRIFLSSTFSDMKAERNALQELVFPRLRDLATAHGCRFQAIDLRWGVSEEAALDQQTMKICLGEIERCQKTSPRPNFIILLGNRYGWRPLPYEIPAVEFEQIVPLVSIENKFLLEQWYFRDDNAVPAVYCLQARSGEFVEYSAWEKVENDLRKILLASIEKLSFSPTAALKYTASATEQEIVAGALKVPDASEHVFCFLRDIQNMPEDGSAASYKEVNPQEAQKQVELKERLKHQLSGNIHEYTARWQADGPSLDHLDHLCADVYAELSKVILAETGKLEIVAPMDAEVAAHETFRNERARVFIGRAEILTAIEKYLTGNAPHPLAIWGVSGSGKSALMAKAVEQARQTGQDILYRFIGATPESSNGRALLESLCKQISRRYQADEATLPLEYKDLVQEFSRRLALAESDRPLILFLDALDQLSDTDNARDLSWVPLQLPPHVHMILSILPGEGLEILRAKLPPSVFMDILPIQPADGSEILHRWLAEAGRRLTLEQEQDLLKKFTHSGGLPLYLKLAFEEARYWHSYSTQILYAGKSGLNDDIPGIIHDLFWRLEQESNHGRLIVAYALGTLAAARNGLSEDEMLDVLWSDPDLRADFFRRSPKSPQDIQALPVVIWSRLYLDLEPYLTWRLADGKLLLGFYHRQLSEAVERRYNSGDEKLARHRLLADYFGKADRSFWINKKEHQPDRRKAAELAYQQTCAGMALELRNTLTAFDFIQARLEGSSIEALIEDFTFALDASDKLPDRDSLLLIQQCLRLSAHVLAHDTSQLMSQLWGRLTGLIQPVIQTFLAQVQEQTREIWLRPLAPCFTPPGGPQQLTLASTTGSTTALAVTPDGRTAVSCSAGIFSMTDPVGGALTVWDLKTGQEKFTLSSGNDYFDNFVAITADGKLAVSGLSEKKFKTWDLETGQEKSALPGAGTIRVAAEAQLAVFTLPGKTITVWDLRTGLEKYSLIGHTEDIGSLAITPDGRLAISGAKDGTIKIWDLGTGRERLSIQAYLGAASAPAITPDGNLAISIGPLEKSLKVWDLQTGQEKFTLAGHSDFVSSVVISSDGLTALSYASYNDLSIKVWDLRTGREKFSLNGHHGQIEIVLISQDGRMAISGSSDTTIKVWDLQTGLERTTLAGHTAKVTSLAFGQAERWLVSGSDDNNLIVWDLESSGERVVLPQHSGSVQAVLATPDGRLAVSASHDGIVKGWDLQTFQERFALTGHTHIIECLALSPNGRLAVSGSGDKTLKVWDLEAQTEEFSLAGHTNMVEVVAITPNGRLAVSGSHDGILKVWDLETGRESFSLAGHRLGVQALAISPNGQLAVSGSEDRTLKVWDLLTGREKFTLSGHTAQVLSVAITPDGQTVISASEDRSLKVWNLGSGREKASLVGHQDMINAVVVSPDGHRVVSASIDCTLKVWDLETMREVFTLTGHTDIVRVAAITNDGRFIVSGSLDQTLKVWDLKTGACLTTFSANAQLFYCRPGFTAEPFRILIGDYAGWMYFLKLENT
jgi:WD40 repeat protein